MGSGNDRAHFALLDTKRLSCPLIRRDPGSRAASVNPCDDLSHPPPNTSTDADSSRNLALSVKFVDRLLIQTGHVGDFVSIDEDAVLTSFGNARHRRRHVIISIRQ